MTGILAGVDQRTRLAGHNRLELLLFRLNGNQRFGINVFKVQEVIHCPPLTKVPHAHHVVRGIANMRGNTIPVLDLSQAIGAGQLQSDESPFVVITEYNRTVQGFLVGSVDRIVNMNWEDILPPPKGVGPGNYMTAVTHVDEEMIEIIDVEKVLKEVMGDRGEVSEGVIEQAEDGKTHHVLVVDDSSVARNQVKRVLDQLGVGCTLATNGLEGYEQLKAWVEEGRDLNSFLSLVISDVEMPRMDGYSLTRAIREDPQLQGIYVILHTSLSGVFNQSMVEQVGADRFIAKYLPDELAELVQTVIKERDAGNQAA